MPSAARDPSDSASATRDVRLHVPVSTILTLLIAAACVWALLRLVPSLVVFFVALVLAVTLWPVVDRMERRGLSRPLSVGMLALGMVAVVALFVFLILPPLANQSIELAANIGAYRRKVQAHLNPDIEVANLLHLARAVIDRLGKGSVDRAGRIPRTTLGSGEARSVRPR